MKKLIDEKLKELKSSIAKTKTDESITKNTRSTKLYALNRERKVLHLIASLYKDDTKLSDEDKDTLILITTLATERVQQTTIEIKEGDSILEVLERYKDKKSSNIMKAAEKKGLIADYKTGKFVARLA